MNCLETIFWLSLSGVVYIYAGYPLLIGLAAAVRPRPHRRAANPCSMSVVIAAFNEAARLPDKLRGLLACEGADRIREIVVVSDGSTDGTPGAARAVGDARIRVVEVPERRGKPSALNAAVPQCTGDVVVMTDARQAIDAPALERLCAALADAEVGVVSGELVFRETAQRTSAAKGLNAYWEYEKWIRRREALVDSVPGATGALYALRRELFRPIPEATLLDDVAIPMQAVAMGARCVFESEALVFDEPSGEPEQEARRKRRTIAGNAQLVRLMPWLLAPWRNRIWFQFVSHKLLRLASPLFLLAALASNLALASAMPYSVLLGVQGAFYLLAAAGWVAQRAGRRFLPGGAAMMFVALNMTTLAALADAARGAYRVRWDR
jgi:biofilm PGA synthesis N-glycosyltransferase PgaC